MASATKQPSVYDGLSLEKLRPIRFNLVVALRKATAASKNLFEAKKAGKNVIAAQEAVDATDAIYDALMKEATILDERSIHEEWTYAQCEAAGIW